MERLRVLSIAGSDPSGGAGVQADLKTFLAHGAYGMAAITALTVQKTGGVGEVRPLPGPFVASQIRAVLEEGVDAVKIGMLANAEIVVAVADSIAGLGLTTVVLDPVVEASSGARLLAEEAVEVLRTRLLPMVSVATPNWREAACLSGRPVTTEKEADAALTALAEIGPAVVLTGGHGPGAEVVDRLARGAIRSDVRRPRVAGRWHGTGCTFSAALAVQLARGLNVDAAVAAAGAFVARTMKGEGGEEVRPLDHAADLKGLA